MLDRTSAGWLASVASAATLVLAFSVTQTRAADRFWAGPFGGAFGAANIWSLTEGGAGGASVPGASDVARFGRTSDPTILQLNYTVSFSSSPTNQAVRVEDDFATFDLNGQTYTTSTATGIVVGTVATRSGRLTVTDGNLNVGAAGQPVIIGALPTASGLLTVSTGGRVGGSPLITVGSTGTGALTVENGGIVNSGIGIIGNPANVTSTATVTGANSLWTATELRVGEGAMGDGRLNITSGGVVQSTIGRVGIVANSFGISSVSGASSRWTNSGSVTIGDNGDGRLSVQAGGLAQNTSGAVAIANNTGSFGSAIVSGAGSQWLMPSILDVGLRSNGMLEISDGGLVRSASGALARITGGHGTVTVSGTNSLWEITSGSLGIGANGNSTVTIRDGGEIRNGEGDVDGFSVVTVTGPGAKWTNSSGLYVRAGSVEVSDGGLITSQSGTIGHTQGGTTDGTVTVRGTNSRWLVTFGQMTVGTGGGSGTLNVNPGGLVDAGLGLFIGSFSASSTGTVNLNGGELQTRSIFVEQTGTLNFNAGTLRLTAADAPLDDTTLDDVLGQSHTIVPLQHLAANNIATLQTSVVLDGGTFSAGQLVNPQLLHIDRGTLNLTNQAVVIEPGGVLGQSLDLDADTEVNVTLGIINRRLVTGDGRIGGGAFVNDTSGELRVEPGRSLTFTGANNTNAGQINLYGGMLDFTQNLTNNSGAFITGNGTLKAAGLTNHGTMNFNGLTTVVGDVINSATGRIISAGGAATTFLDDVINSGEIRTSAGSFTTFFGAATGSGTYSGSGTVNFEGDLKPGNSPAAISFGGNVGFGVEAELTMELGGLLAGSQFDQVTVAGNLDLDGVLQVALINGFAPVAGNSFDLLNWTSLSGTFASLSLPALTGGLTWNTSQLYTTGVLSVVSAGITGDYNNNGIVDAADYVVWRNVQGTSTVLPNDPTGGTIGPAQYATWRSHFGQTAGSGAGSTNITNAAVPEPASAALLLIAATGTFAAWRRRGC